MVEAVFRNCPVVVFPGYSRARVRVRDFLALVEENTYDGRTRVRSVYPVPLDGAAED